MASDEPYTQRSLAGERTAELVRLLAELETTDEIGTYNLLANKIEVCADALLQAKRAPDAYRAALVYARHASEGQPRPTQLRREAGQRLARLLHFPALAELAIDEAIAGRGLASVQASQVLMAAGQVAIAALVNRHARCAASARAVTASVLIALGDGVLPALAEELASGEPERLRRALLLLGEVQNPNAIPVLADALLKSDPRLAREAAQALARIGSDAAIRGLVDALRRKPELAEPCVAALAGSRRAVASSALIEVAGGEGRYPEGVRREAIRNLGRASGHDVVRVLVVILDRAPFFSRARLRPLRIAAAQALGQIGGPVALSTLHTHARKGDTAVRQACKEALKRMEKAVGTRK